MRIQINAGPNEKNEMSETFKKYITAVSAALFLVVAGSGLAMFFGVGKHLVMEMHEWLAVIFVVAIGLHLVRNWGGMTTYIRKRTIFAPVALAAAAAAAFMVPAALSEHDSPMPALFRSLEQAKLDDLAPVLGVPAESMAVVLEQRGFIVHSTDLSLSEIATDSDRKPKSALMTLLDAKRQ